MKRFELGVAAGAALLWVVGCTDVAPEDHLTNHDLPCSTWEDCTAFSTSEGGLCFPAELVCEAGTCHRRCRQLCETVDPHVTVCEAGLICNKSASSEVGGCMANPIPCTTIEDCPLFLPAGPDEAAWECLGGLCRFAGFVYESER